MRFFTDSNILYLALFYNSRVREAIKALVEDGRYDYIETGSLISIKENVEDILIPSEEHSIRMYPMDFEEFCMACGEEQLLDFIKTLQIYDGIPGYLSKHEKRVTINNIDAGQVTNILGDAGLLLSHAFSEKEITEGELYKKLLNDRLSINKGMLSNGSKTNYKIDPVEVKSSKNYTTTSLTAFKNKYKKRVETSYVIHPKNLRIDNEIMYMPVYMTFLL